MSDAWRRGVLGLALVLLVPTLSLAEPRSAAETSLWTSGETALTLGLLSGAGLLSLFDEDIRREIQRREHNTLDSLADGLNLLAHPASGLGLSAALWGVAVLREDEPLAQTSQMAFEAVFLGQAATALLKVGVGRKRPDDQEDGWSFRPFSFASDHDSWPSAHTANAFALAGVVSRRSAHPWVPWLSYGLASLAGAARLQSDDHWASDVLVGALIGELSARMVLRFHEQHPQFFLGAGPMHTDGAGFYVTWNW